MRWLSVGHADVRVAADILRAGGVVIFPTESYYGAAVRARDEAAVELLLRLKGRPDAMPLPLILADRGGLTEVVAKVPAAAQSLMDLYWPGPLTLVLPARPGLPSSLVGPLGVGVRLSSHPVARALAQALGCAITATSANVSGVQPARNARAAALALPGADAVLDGGETSGGPPSTVLAVAADGGLTLLRQGAVSV